MSWQFWGKSVPHQTLTYRPIHRVSLLRSCNLNTCFQYKIKMKSGGKRNIYLETSKFTFRFLKNCIFLLLFQIKFSNIPESSTTLSDITYSVSHTRKHPPEKKCGCKTPKVWVKPVLSPKRSSPSWCPLTRGFMHLIRHFREKDSNAAEATQLGTQPRVGTRHPRYTSHAIEEQFN